MKTEYITKVLEFAQLDLDKVSNYNKSFVMGDVNSIVKGPFEPFEVEKDFNDHLWQKTITFQKKWDNFLGCLIPILDKDCDMAYSIPSRVTWRKEDGYFRRTFEQNSFEEISIKLSSYNSDGKVIEEKECTLPPGGLHFLDALVDWPIRSLIKCAHCGKIFFNNSKRDMKFCSASCQRAAAAKRVRDRKKAEGTI